MKNQHQMSELTKAILEGYIHDFIFCDGKVSCSLEPGVEYVFADVVRSIRPCPIDEQTVYCVQTPNGRKGIVRFQWSEFQTPDI